MKDNLQRDLLLDGMAQNVNLSSSRFRYLFKAETGATPARYFKSLRMEKAKELIETTFLNMKEIMRKVGIKDKSQFARDFKNVYGSSPTEYRKRHFVEATISETARAVGQSN